MSYTVTELITRSWYLSGIVARDLETVSGDQLNDGLQMLNALLSVKTADQRLIPYYTQYDFTAVQGQEKYFIANLIHAETLVFFIQSVRYSVIPKTRRPYFGTPRAENVLSLPFECHYERCFGGSNLYIYFNPNENYPMTLWGKFSLEDVTLNEDLSLVYDAFYIEYLRYALAEYMCQEYNIVFGPQSQKKLDQYENILVDISPMDLSLNKVSCLQRITNFNYGDANLGRGWRP